jgi:alanine dehydrogenase
LRAESDAVPGLPLPLQRAEVRELLPSLLQQIDLAEHALRTLAEGRAEMPPKIGVHPRKDSFLHAMPVYLSGEDVTVLKWVSGYPANRTRGIPYISGVIVINGSETGVPIAILDASEITAARTAAASGACIRAWAPSNWKRVAVLGCGEQGLYHAEVVRALRSDVEIVGYDPVAARTRALGADVEVAQTPRAAVEGADVVITAGPIVSRPPSELVSAWVGPEWLALPIDFDFYASAELVATADLFLTDDVAQFTAYQSHGHFDGWRAPDGSVGEALGSRRAARVVACNLGVAALDAVFAACVLKAAGVGALGLH